MDKNNELKNFKGFVFDFDGTLVDSKINFNVMKKKIVELMKKWNVYIEKIENGYYALELVEIGCKSLKKQPTQKDLFRNEAFKIIEQIELDSCSKAIPFPQAKKALQKLHSLGYKIGIISRNGRAAINAMLSRFSIPYDVMYTRDDIERIKPDPLHLLSAIKSLHLDREEVAMVGDHPIDIMCGKAAEVFTIGVLSSVSTERELINAGADLVVPDVGELVEHVI